jgi:sulfide dehydrogenase cytochrome subunit
MTSKLNSWLTASLVYTALLAAGSPAMRAAQKPHQMKPSVDDTMSARGQILSLSCASCHGTDGKSAGIIPSIYGRSPQYIETALREFKSGARYSTVMGRHAKGYSDEEIHLIAEYFGTFRQKNK